MCQTQDTQVMGRRLYYLQEGFVPKTSELSINQWWRRQRGYAPLTASRSMEPVTNPYNELDVDRELWDLLDLAHDDELQAVHDILYGESGILYSACAAMLQAGILNLHKGTVLLCYSPGVSPLSPLLKSILQDNEPAAMAHRGRASIMHRIESRFRFLAVCMADAFISHAHVPDEIEVALTWHWTARKACG